MLHTSIIQCARCNKTFKVTYEIKDLQDYKYGGRKEECLKYLTENERRLLVNNVCEKCYSVK